MMIKVRFFNILAAYAGAKQEMVELPQKASVFDLVQKLAQDHSPAFRDVILPDAVPNPHLHFFRNGTRLGSEELTSPLDDGDEILLFPAVAGGFCSIQSNEV